MKILRDHQVEILLILVMVLLGSLPYLLASLSTPAGFVFSGFLVNPLDGFSYLAKMNQGRLGDWLFQLPYAAEPGQPALLFTFYVFLGHLARLLSLSNLLIFHIARVASTALMALTAHLFFKQTLPTLEIRRWALAIFTLGSGLGWLVAPFGWLTSDFVIPESIPFFAAAINPHFPLTYACLAIVALLVLKQETNVFSVGFCLTLGLVVGAVQPFAALLFVLVLGGWLLWDGWIEYGDWFGWRWKTGLWSSLAFAMGAAPWLLYDFWLTQNHSVLRLWNAQNQTPSPNPFAYIVGFGIPLVLSAIGLGKNRKFLNSSHRLIIVWLAATAVLLYLPFNFQRRFVLGAFLPIAAAAGLGVAVLTSQFQLRRWLPYVMLALALPSNLIAMAAGVVLAAEGSPLLLMTESERSGYQWIAENVHQDALVLAAPTTGNRLPAFARVRVVYGHPFETPNAGAKEEEVIDLYSMIAAMEVPRTELKRLGVEFVVIGPHEQALIGAKSIESLDWPQLFGEDNFHVLEVPPP